MPDVQGFIRSTEPPYVLNLLRDDGQLIRTIEASGASVIALDAATMPTLRSAFECFAKAFKFPSMVANYAGFEDWMRDLSWLKSKPSGWVVIIKQEARLLAREPHQRSKLIEALATIAADWAQPIENGEWWDRPPVPFHVLLVS